jgi:hypothetical protein
LLAATVAPERKLEPLRVTEIALPWMPEDGIMEVKFGGLGLTVKTTGREVPAEVVTVTLAVPLPALTAIAKVAVI